MQYLFFSALIVLQILAYICARALLWQFRIVSPAKRRLAYALCFAVADGLMLGAFLTRIHVLFRLNAAVMVLLLFVALTALAVIVLRFAAKRFRQPEKLARDLRVAAPCLFAGLIALSVYNAYTPVVRHVSVRLDKPLAKPIRIALAADTHLGVLVGARQLDKLAAIMAQERPDIILLAGDIMDDDTEAYHAENMQPHLAKLRAPLGVYATLGNHDYHNTPSITRAIEDAGITVLHDEVRLIDSSFWLIGRPDNLDTHRLPAVKLLERIPDRRPVILMDHRPDQIEQHARLPIDLQVSGHVHNGQVFPANLIVKQLYRLPYGHEAIGNGHFVVTSGFGFWGIPFRLGSQSEVWIIDVSGTEMSHK